METLMELVKKLKNNLLVAVNNDYKSDQWISEEDIHRIRKGIDELNKNSNQTLKMNFLSNCFDFRSIYEYFFHNYDNQYSPDESITALFDPILIALMETDYEVNIRKISTTEKISQIYPSLISNLDAMEQAYHELEYERVTSLSSTILQSLFKQICDLEKIEYTKTEKFPQLFKKVKDVLKIDPKEYKDNPPLRDFCSSINAIVTKLNEIRNLYSESHGVSQNEAFNYEKLRGHHIKLILDSTKTIVNFLLDSYDFQYNSLKI